MNYLSNFSFSTGIKFVGIKYTFKKPTSNINDSQIELTNLAPSGSECFAIRVGKDTQRCFINALDKSLWVLRKLRFV